MTITIKDLRERIKDLPDGMPVILCDLEDDDEDGGGIYNIEKDSVFVESATKTATGRNTKVLMIAFKNRHL